MKLSMDQLNRLNADQFKQERKFPIIIVLDNIRSMMNIGSVFRTSDAFRIEKIILCGITACPPNKEIHKTALGATESVDWEYFEDTCQAIEKLKQEGYRVLALEQTTQSENLMVFTPDINSRYVLVFGNEVKGVQDDVLKCCDATLEIPQFGTKHSFNIAVSAGIVIWDFFSKMQHNTGF
jgi:23S rRNA (guanosine2251-2'-O)-methyltransferase